MKLKFEEMRSPEIAGFAEKNGMVLVPIGACEEHGRHLPVITDTKMAYSAALDAARSVSGEIPISVLPAVWFGYSVNMLKNWAGTITIRPKVMIDLMYRTRSGHLDTCLSLVEIWLGLVYSDFFQFDPQNGAWEDRDRIFLSEGHACPLQYFVNADLGYFTREDVFAGFRKPFTPFQGHTLRDLSCGLENSNGSLGIGLWQAYGQALVTDRYVFCIAGDGEFEEPSSQGLLSAPFFLKSAPNYILLLNYNRLSQDDTVDIGPIADVAGLYGWQVMQVDGHNFQALDEVCQQAVKDTKRPTFIVCDTIKGLGGAAEFEAKLGHHGVPPKNEEEYNAYLADLEASRRV